MMTWVETWCGPIMTWETRCDRCGRADKDGRKKWLFVMAGHTPDRKCFYYCDRCETEVLEFLSATPNPQGER